MNPVWSQFIGRFVSFLKHVWSTMKDTEAAASAVEAWSAKIGDWASVMIGLFVTSTMAIAVSSRQVQTALSLSIFLGFSFLLLAEFVKFRSLKTNQILRCLSFFFLVMAFFIAISDPFDIYFKITSLIVFLILCFAAICGHPGTGGTPTTDQKPSQEFSSAV